MCGFIKKQKHPPEAFYKKDVLKILTNFTGKHLYWSLFVNKVASLRHSYCSVGS